MNWSDYFYYDETSPSCLRWKVNRRVARKDAIAGCLKNVGSCRYWYVGLYGKQLKVHRVIWEMHNEPISNKTWIDHINGDGSDNKIDNMRLATPSQNNQNKKLAINNKSGYKGVSFYNRLKKWKSSIEIEIDSNRKCITIGHFQTPEEAARAYDKKAIELFGEFALTNEKLGLL